MFKWEDGWIRLIFFGTIEITGLVLVGYYSSWWVTFGLMLVLWPRTIYSRDHMAHYYLSKVNYDQYALPYIETLAWNQAGKVIDKAVEPSIVKLQETLDSLSYRIRHLEGIAHKNHLR